MTRFNILTDSQVKSTRVELLMFTLAVVVVDWATKALAVISVGGLKHVPLSSDIYSGLAIFPQIQSGWVGLCVVQHQVSSGGALMSGLSFAGFTLLAFFCVPLAQVLGKWTKHLIVATFACLIGGGLANYLEGHLTRGVVDWIGLAQQRAGVRPITPVASYNLADVCLNMAIPILAIAFLMEASGLWRLHAELAARGKSPLRHGGMTFRFEKVSWAGFWGRIHL